MRFILAALSALFMSACQTTANSSPVPAVLEKADEASMTILKSTLAKAMKRPSIALGAGDLTQSPRISVLPKRSALPPGSPQNQAGNFALPMRFTLMMDGSSCYLVKDGADEKITLTGVKCRPANQISDK